MKKTRIYQILMLALLISLAVPMIGLVFAQEPEPTTLPTEGQTILQVVAAWLIYSMVGMVANIVQPDGKFDAWKLMRSFLWAIVVAVLAIGLGLHPTVVETTYSNLITEVVNFLANSGFGISLIYTFEKLYTIILGVATRVKQTASVPGT
jgi:NO-binding membrane sensor protein with MHYT domain